MIRATHSQFNRQKHSSGRFRRIKDQGDDASPSWDEVMRPALVIVGPATVARKMELGACLLNPRRDGI